MAAVVRGGPIRQRFVEFRTLNGMAMGKKPGARQASPMGVNTKDLPTSGGHPFFERLNRILAESGFDTFVEGLCAAFYADRLGQPIRGRVGISGCCSSAISKGCPPSGGLRGGWRIR